jgi:tripartite-type tricarboxylate transporter receptor subunit TctC
VKEGRLRLLAVTTPRRSPSLPDVPAIAESLPGYEFTGWMGFLVPVKVTRPIVDKLYKDPMIFVG